MYRYQGKVIITQNDIRSIVHYLEKLIEYEDTYKVPMPIKTYAKKFIKNLMNV